MKKINATSMSEGLTAANLTVKQRWPSEGERCFSLSLPRLRGQAVYISRLGKSYVRDHHVDLGGQGRLTPGEREGSRFKASPHVLEKLYGKADAPQGSNSAAATGDECVNGGGVGVLRTTRSTNIVPQLHVCNQTNELNCL